MSRTLVLEKYVTHKGSKLKKTDNNLTIKLGIPFVVVYVAVKDALNVTKININSCALMRFEILTCHCMIQLKSI